jgi:hypothetical protein
MSRSRSRSPALEGAYVPATLAPSELELQVAQAIREVALTDGGLVALFEVIKRKDPASFVKYLFGAGEIIQRDAEARRATGVPHTRQVLSAVPKTALAADTLPYRPPQTSVVGDCE